MSTRLFTGTVKKALIVENPSPVIDSHLQDAGIEVLRLETVPNEAGLIEAINQFGAQAVFKRSRVEITRRVIESCPTLLVVQLCCIGDDSVDKLACAEHGVMVFNDPVSNGHSVVELAIGQLISLSRRLYQTNTTCRDGLWEKNNLDRYEIAGKVLGVVGLGNIGRKLARTAQQLGMKICFFDTRQVSVELGRELGWKEASSLEDVFRNSDAVSLHLSAQDIKGLTNEGRITEEILQQLGADRPEGPRIFLNLSRGFLHRPEDLVAAVQSGAIKHAAVDVYPLEPRKGEGWANPYANEPRIIVTPHIGASTQEAQPRIGERVSDTFLSFSQLGGIRDTPFQPRFTLHLNDKPQSGEAILMVCHATAKGTKRAIDEVIYDSDCSNLSSAHQDFNNWSFAYDLARLDKPLTLSQLKKISQRASQLTGQDNVIHSIRQVIVP